MVLVIFREWVQQALISEENVLHGTPKLFQSEASLRIDIFLLASNKYVYID